MTTTTTERVLTIEEAAALLRRRGYRLDVKQLWRWTKLSIILADGSCARLETNKIGWRTVTSLEALARFIEQAGPALPLSLVSGEEPALEQVFTPLERQIVAALADVPLSVKALAKRLRRASHLRFELEYLGERHLVEVERGKYRLTPAGRQIAAFYGLLPKEEQDR